jgi:general secretion pathway protein D
VIFDSDLGQKLTTQVPVDLNNVTVIEALDLLALQTKTYWAVVNPNTIIVTNDNQQTRQFYEEQIIKTFYLANTLATADLQEILNTLRTLLDLRKVGVINSQNAIVIRDTADKIAMAERILLSIDKAKPEVLIDVAVLEVDRSYKQTLGVKPPTSITAANPPGSTGTTVSIKDADRLGSGNFYFTIPTATFLATRTNAKVLQNPSLRASDGKVAKLRIGTQQPSCDRGEASRADRRPGIRHPRPSSQPNIGWLHRTQKTLTGINSQVADASRGPQQKEDIIAACSDRVKAASYS